MKAQIIERPVSVYSEANLSSSPVTRLLVDSQLEMGGVKWSAGIKWVSVSLGDGRRGYMFADTKVLALKQAALLQSDVDVCSKTVVNFCSHRAKSRILPRFAGLVTG